VKLGEVCHFQNGRAFKKSEWSESGLPIIRIQNLKNERTEHNYYEGEYDERIFVTNGDLLLSWSGTVKPFIWCHGDALLNQHVFKVSASTQINQGYSFYLFQNILDEISKQKVGIGLQHITKKTFENFRVTLPPLEEQQRIVEKLDRAFAAIDKAIDLAYSKHKVLKIKFEKMLDDKINGRQTDEAYSEKYLGDLAEFVDYRGKTPQKEDVGIRLLTAKNVRMGFIKSEPLEFVSLQTYKQHMTRGFPSKGDVVITTEAPLGLVAEIDDDSVALGQRLITLKVNSKLMSSKFLKYSLMSKTQQKKIQDAGTGATVKGIKASLLKKISIPYPSSLAEQEQRVICIEAIQKKINVLEQIQSNKLGKLNSLKSAILKQALQPPQQ
jgi:type I restriction enzyme S subunit